MDRDFTKLSRHVLIPWAHRVREMLWFFIEHGPHRRFTRRAGIHRPLRPRHIAGSRTSRDAGSNDNRDRDAHGIVPAPMRVTWVGHASTVLDAGEHRLLLDPVWSERLVGFVPRMQPPGLAWDAVGTVDAVLVSHDHGDHMDKPTLLRLPRDTTVIVPIGVGGWFRRKQFTDVRELDWWQATRIGDVDVTLTPAHHGSGHGWGRVRRLWGGFLVHHAGLTAFYAGDTGYGDVFQQVADHCAVDLAILPIGAYAPREVNGAVHMDPEQAVQAFQDLGARILVPVHWGTFRLSPEPVHEPIDRLEAAWAAKGIDAHRLSALDVGDTRAVTPRAYVVPQRRPTTHPAPAPAPAHAEPRRASAAASFTEGEDDANRDDASRHGSIDSAPATP